MRIIDEPSVVRHKVGVCPACRWPLWAEVQLTIEVGEPHLDENGRAHVRAYSHPTGTRLEHYCTRDDEGEWTAIASKQALAADSAASEASEVPEGHRDAESGVCAAGVGGGEVCMRPAGHDGDHDPDSTEVAG